MRYWQQASVLLLLVSLGAAQTLPGRAAKVEDVQVTRHEGNLTVEIRLSAAVQPSAESVANPDRLILILPGTVSDARQKRIPVHANGVRAVRVGLNSSEPPVTRVVVDLESALPYTLSTKGNSITLQLQSPIISKSRSSAPAPAASASALGSVFGRPKPLPAPPETNNSNTATAVPPPPSLPPIQVPSQPRSATAQNAPSAAHPNFGSLQQGAVNPGMGAPGTGVVPPALGGQTSVQNAGVAQSTENVRPQTSSSEAGARSTTSESFPPDGMLSGPSSIATVSGPASPNSVSQPTAASAAAASPSVAAAPPGFIASAPDNQPSSLHADSASSAGQPMDALEPGNPKLSPSKDPTIPELAARRANPDFRIAFRVKYVASGAAYLDGGRSAGLAEGMKLIVRDTPGGVVATPVTSSEISTGSGTQPSLAGGPAANSPEGSDPAIIAELEVISVAEASAVTDIHDPRRNVKAGDLAYLSSAEQDALVQKSALSSTRKYPMVIAFTEDDTLDDEARAEVPHPPLLSVNRARGRVGVDYLGTISHGSGGGISSDLGLVTRLDMTRIGGTYWTASGYWRGRLSSSSYSGQQSLQDLINRTYHLSLTYDNPNSSWVAGFGRMYLPWATSLDTIDGGYFGRRLGHAATLGLFLGSTPDPTSYSYNPDQQITGSFINFEGGSFDHFKYTSTMGAGVSMLNWSAQNPFVFFENGLYYKRVFSLYDAVQLDSPSGNQAVAAPGFGVGRNFLTARYMPHARVEFNASYNYFRDLPTFNPTLIGTGLLDKFLFQGFSGGVRVEVLKQIWLYTDIGKSDRTGDPTSALNQLYGITFGNVPWLKMRADAHYSKFDSSFGSGKYEAVSLTRNLNESMYFQFLAGNQTFSSQFTSNTQSKFATTNLDFNIGMHYFLQGGFTISRGATMDYDQYMFTLGYRFDTKRFKAQ
jgi:hypothetical protein